MATLQSRLAALVTAIAEDVQLSLNRWAAGYFKLGNVTPPNAENINAVIIHGLTVCGLTEVVAKDNAGIVRQVEPYYRPNASRLQIGVGTAVIATNIGSYTASGTVSVVNPATTDSWTRRTRHSRTIATTGGVAGYYGTTGLVTMATSSDGGFLFRQGFAYTDARTDARIFVGVRSATAAPANASPATYVNCIGLGVATGNAALLYYGGSAAQTPINLGFNFAANVGYELTLYSPPGSTSSVYYQVTNLSTKAVLASGLITGTAGTQLPAATTLLTFTTFRMATTAVAVAFQTDYLILDPLL